MTLAEKVARHLQGAETHLVRARAILGELERRQVITDFRPDYALQLMVEVRLDNDEVISTRPLTLAERNAVLFFEEEDA